jgi:hypothetical protein
MLAARSRTCGGSGEHCEVAISILPPQPLPNSDASECMVI